MPEFAGNPMENMLENEGVSSPMVFVRSLESAWEAWRNNELDDDEVLQSFVFCVTGSIQFPRSAQ